MNENINNKYQCNEAIEYEPNSENKFSLYSGNTVEPLLVLTASLIRGKKNRARIVFSLTLLWDSEYTDRMIKMLHIKYYARIMNYNKV